MITKKPIPRSNADSVKYTFQRDQDHLKDLERVRSCLRVETNKNFKTDSSIYRELPLLFLDAVKEKHELELTINKLNAELDHLKQLQTHIAYIVDLCGVKK